MASPPSPAQRAVLEWLLAYPGVEISYSAGWLVGWTVWWRSSEAREHMGPIVGVPQTRTTPLVGGTPRITMQTFGALQRRGLLRMTKRSRREFYYTISKAGVRAIRPLPAMAVG